MHISNVDLLMATKKHASCTEEKKRDRLDSGRTTLIAELFAAPKKQNKDAPRSVGPQKAINGRRQYYSATFNYAFLLPPETRAGPPSRDLIRNLIGRQTDLRVRIPRRNKKSRPGQTPRDCFKCRSLSCERGLTAPWITCAKSRCRKKSVISDNEFEIFRGDTYRRVAVRNCCKSFADVKLKIMY